MSFTPVDLAKTFDPHTSEKRIYAFWDNGGWFRAGVGASSANADTFCILIPPPNVTGSLHMGHAFNNTLQDILIRWHRMRGYSVLWQAGQDHAGIATQMVVERTLAQHAAQHGTAAPTRQELGRDRFLQHVWQWKQQSGGTIIEQLQRLGVSCDWSRNAFTMDDGFQRVVAKVFVDFYKRGLIYKDRALVNWDPHFASAISDLEVETKEIQGQFWHIQYKLENGETYDYVERDENGDIVLQERRDYIAIATTRPETMLGDGAVAVHPSDARYAGIVGKRVLLPLADRYIPIIQDDYPDPNFGSGAVKITGAHDFNDYKVALRHNLPLYVLLDDHGCMRDDDYIPMRYRGLDRFVARQRIAHDLAAQGLLVKCEDKTIAQPFGDRSKVVIEPMLKEQWFVDTQQIVQPAIDAVEQGEIRILPEQDAKVYLHWLRHIEPWCISRQIWWGHRIPVWYDAQGRVYCAETETAARAMAAKNGQTTLTRDTDVLDTWFSSSLWPIGTLGWPEQTLEMQRYFPTDVLITGFDIIFFWVARMVMMQYAVVGQKPFHTVYVHALVRDEQGKKMSKSLGNIVDPLDLIDQYGTDAVRLTLAILASPGRDVRLSLDRVAGYRNFVTKLWNAARFALKQGAYDPALQQQPFDAFAVQGMVNQWIIGATVKTRNNVHHALQEYRFNDAAQALYTFVWRLVCDWYIEFSKPLLLHSDGAQQVETKRTMAWVLDQCLLLLHPIIPFVTEDLWGKLAVRDTPLIAAAWPCYDAVPVPYAPAEHNTHWIIRMIEEIRSVRSEVNCPAAARIPLLVLQLDADYDSIWHTAMPLVCALARIDTIERAAIAPTGAITCTLDGIVFCLPLAGVIDIAAETARLHKARAACVKEMHTLQQRLNTPQFLASAPAAVVAATRTRLQNAETTLQKIDLAEQRLAQAT